MCNSFKERRGPPTSLSVTVPQKLPKEYQGGATHQASLNILAFVLPLLFPDFQISEWQAHNNC